MPIAPRSQMPFGRSKPGRRARSSVLAQRSSNYTLVPVAWAAALALLVPLPLIYLTSWPASVIYMLQLVCFVAKLGLARPALRFRLVPSGEARRAHSTAMRQFWAQRLNKTQKRTGVLIFVSLAEHYAEIIADAESTRRSRPTCGRTRSRR